MLLLTQISLVIALAVGLWIAALWINGTEVKLVMLAPFGVTVGVVTTVAIFFEKVAWKWPLINGLLVRRPPLAGTWRTELQSSYSDENGVSIRKTVYVVIQQSLRTMSVRMYTDKARSFSIAESIRSSESDDLFELSIVYQSVPEIQHRQYTGDSLIHFGALHLTDIPQHPESIAGPYWTDRNTNGHLRLVERKSARISSYAEGVALFS